jgi:hypothetical protein
MQLSPEELWEIIKLHDEKKDITSKVPTQVQHTCCQGAVNELQKMGQETGMAL